MHVRLTENQIQQIIKSILAISPLFQLELTEISLFGSRVNLHAKGGDIDLYVKFTSPVPIDEVRLKLKILDQLYLNLGEQKIDLVIDNSNTSLGAFGEIINAQKVVLWKKI